MKHVIASFCAVCGIALLAAGCASTAVSLAEHAPVAIVSVSGNASVPWHEGGRAQSEQEEASGGKLTGMANRALNAGNPEVQTIQSRIDGAAETLRQLMEQEGVAVVPPEEVQGCGAVAGRKFSFDLSDNAVADGYKKISPSGALSRQVAAQTGAGSTLYAEFTFQKQKFARGLTEQEVAARATLSLYVADAAGKRLLQRTYHGLSADRVPYEKGHWDRQALCDLFPQAVEDAVYQFLLDYAGRAEETPGAGDADDAQPVSIAKPARTAPAREGDGAEQEGGSEADAPAGTAADPAPDAESPAQEADEPPLESEMEAESVIGTAE